MAGPLFYHFTITGGTIADFDKSKLNRHILKCLNCILTVKPRQSLLNNCFRNKCVFCTVF